MQIKNHNNNRIIIFSLPVSGMVVEVPQLSTFFCSYKSNQIPVQKQVICSSILTWISKYHTGFLLRNLICSLNLFMGHLYPFPLVAMLSFSLNCCSPSLVFTPLTYLQRAFISPLSLCFPGLNKPNTSSSHVYNGFSIVPLIPEACPFICMAV